MGTLITNMTPEVQQKPDSKHALYGMLVIRLIPVRLEAHVQTDCAGDSKVTSKLCTAHAQHSATVIKCYVLFCYLFITTFADSTSAIIIASVISQQGQKEKGQLEEHRMLSIN